MKTPIFDFVKKYADSGAARFHMPGHKGRGLLGCEPFDVTEIIGADTLYSADGIIEESENNATALFGTAHTYYSAEGSTLAIKAMLALATAGKGKKPLILAARNAHKAFIHAAALLDLRVEWLYPKDFSHLCCADVTADDVECAIVSGEKPAALYITTPDYLGNITDVSAISRVCKKYGVTLLVDNAHGAYLKFLSPSRHPIDLGADMCADSAHKTLPVLTGGAYLHISGGAPLEYTEAARDTLSVFASTSPSYLILQSLDLCNKYLSDEYEKKLSLAIERVKSVKSKISELGITVVDTEPLKITLNATEYGYTGHELSNLLHQNGIEPEFFDTDYTVLMATPENCDTDYDVLVKLLSSLPRKDRIEKNTLKIYKKEPATSIREAIFSRGESVSVQDAVGRISAAPAVSCPPAIPIVVSGERISEEDVVLFKKYGIEKVRVVKN